MADEQLDRMERAIIAINHNTTVTAEATKSIAENTKYLGEVYKQVVDNTKLFLSNNKFLVKILGTAFSILAAIVGIKIVLGV